MPDNIFAERFIARRDAAWHNLGTVFPENEQIDVTAAFERAKAMFTIEKFPCWIKAFGKSIKTDKTAVVREPLEDDPHLRILGYVSNTYQIIQNAEIAKMLNPLAEEWPVETVGVLGQGETIFVTLYAGDAEVRGDYIKQYFLVSDTKGGGRALHIAVTPVRVVCQNTLISGLAAASIDAAVYHRPGAHQQTQFRIDLVASMRKARLETLKTFERMSLSRLVKDQIEEVLLAAYPEPKTTSAVRLYNALTPDDLGKEAFQEEFQRLAKSKDRLDYHVERMANIRDLARKCHDKLCDEFPPIANTAWSIYNAVVECEDYRKGEESLYESAIFGQRAQTKARAFKQALKFSLN